MFTISRLNSMHALMVVTVVCLQYIHILYYTNVYYKEVLPYKQISLSVVFFLFGKSYHVYKSMSCALDNHLRRWCTAATTYPETDTLKLLCLAACYENEGNENIERETHCSFFYYLFCITNNFDVFTASHCAVSFLIASFSLSKAEGGKANDGLSSVTFLVSAGNPAVLQAEVICQFNYLTPIKM